MVVGAAPTPDLRNPIRFTELHMENVMCGRILKYTHIHKYATMSERQKDRMR